MVIRPSTSLLELRLGEVWQYREVLYYLVWRDVKVRYKQTAIGVGWAVLQPLLATAIFTVIFGLFARMPSDGLPYSLFALAALLPWTYFAQAAGRGVASLVGNAQLITKVYFPRLIIPLSSVLTPLVDLAVAFLTLLGLMAWFRIVPSWGVLTLPLFVSLNLLAALAVSLVLAPLNVRYRDVSHAIPFLIQVWMYLSPVVYPLSLVPERWRLLYSINPMVGIIEGFRWALLGKEAPDLPAIAMSVMVIGVLLIWGLTVFKRMERTFADVV